MVTIATAPDGTFYNDIISQDVDDYTFNGISRDAFLFDEAGVYRFEGGIVSPTDSADVVPIQVATGARIESLQVIISNFQEFYQGSDIIVESTDGLYYKSYSVENFTTSDVLEAGGYNLYFRNDAFDYSLTFNVSMQPVNQAPTITGSVNTLVMDDDVTATPFSNVVFSDNESDGGSVSILYTGVNGTFSGTGLSGLAGNYTLSGSSPTELTNRLQALVFTPLENQLSPGLVQQTAFSLTPSDGQSVGSSFSDVAVAVTSVNDAPTALSLDSTTLAHSDGTSGTVGRLTTTDSDTNDTYSYALVAGSGDDNNALFSIDNDSLSAIDSATMVPGDYQVRIQTQDASGETNSDTFTISVVDDVAPTVTSIVPSGSPGAAASEMDFAVTFSEGVDNVSTDDFLITSTGTATGTVTAVSGSGGGYTVSVSGISGIGTLRLDVKGGSDIDDGASNSLVGYTSGAVHSVDLVPPSVTNISSITPNGTYKTGDTVAITLEFSEAVSVTGTPQLKLETGNTDRDINYSAGSGSTTLTFTYVVQAGDESSDLALAVAEIQLNGGSIKDAAGNDAVVTLPSPGSGNSLSFNKDIVIDAVPPTITSVTIPDSNYKIGDAVTVTIAASESGLSLASGTLNEVALTDFTDLGGGNYSATYTVQEGDASRISGDDIPVSVVLSDTAGNVSTAYTAPISQNADGIDAARPILEGVITPSVPTITDAQVGSGTFTLAVSFNEVMDTAIAPTIDFPAEDPTNTLTFVSGSWVDSATYIASFNTDDANEVVTNVDVRVSNAQDAAGNTLTAVTQANLFTVMTAPAPVVQAITSPSASDTFAVGDTVTFNLIFNKSVDFTANGGTLSATLNTGATALLANSDASDQTLFNGSYLIQEGEADTDALTITAINVAGGATLVAHDNGVPAEVSLPSGQNLADVGQFIVDANTPLVSAAVLNAVSDSGV